jgi:hypothetical protein
MQFLRPTRLLGLLVLWSLYSTTLSAQDTPADPPYSLYFATASAELDGAARTQLERLIADQTGFQDFSLTIEAHTDDRGTDEYNAELAQRRARSVANFLERRGLTPRHIEVVSFGESQARFRAGDDATRRPDRRVDIRIDRAAWTGLDAITAELRDGRTQQFTFDAETTQILQGARGGQFLLDAGSLVDATTGQPYRGPVVATLTECYTMDAMLLAQLSTTAQGQLLETGGMLQLTAAAPDGTPLSLAEGRKVYAAIPTREYDDQMRIFYGQNHADDGAPQDWALTPGRVQSGFEAFLPGRPPIRTVDLDLLVGKYMNRWRQENPEPEAPTLAAERRAVAPGPEPDPNTKRYRPRGIFARLFTGKDKRAEREAQLYQQAQDRYEKKQARYASALAHNATIDERNAALQTTYAAQRQDWHQRLLSYQQSTRTRLEAEYAEQLRQDSLNYVQWREQRLTQMEAAFAENGLADRRLADRYFFEISELGWVNCDVFYNNTAERTKVLVRDETGATAPKIIMVLREPRALLALNPDATGHFSSGEVPVGLSSDLIAYKVEAGRLLLAERRFVTGAAEPLELEYRPVAVTELRAVLARYQDS